MSEDSYTDANQPEEPFTIEGFLAWLLQWIIVDDEVIILISETIKFDDWSWLVYQCYWG